MCPQLATPSNGMVTWNSLVVGGVATYTCADGFELVGSMTRTCQSNNTWSEEEPICRGILLGSDFLYIRSISGLLILNKSFIIIVKIEFH